MGQLPRQAGRSLGTPMSSFVSIGRYAQQLYTCRGHIVEFAYSVGIRCIGKTVQSFSMKFFRRCGYIVVVLIHGILHTGTRSYVSIFLFAAVVVDGYFILISSGVVVHYGGYDIVSVLLHVLLIGIGETIVVFGV